MSDFLWHRRVRALAIVCAGFLLSVPAHAWLVEQGDREVRIETGRLSVVVRDGAFVEVRDTANGRVWADRKTADHHFPTGLGVLIDLERFREGHIPWGDSTMGQHLPPDFDLVNYLRPVKESRYSVAEEPRSVVIKWDGLSNGRTFYEKATLELLLKESNEGTLAYQIKGYHEGGGVFGAIAPVLNLSRKARVIVPSFGGVEYRMEGAAALMPFGGSPFMEAPILIATDGEASLSMWTEDETMRSFYAFFKRAARGGAFGMELHNLMPYETHQTIATPVHYLRAFEGDWKAAATPLRNWYRETFREEIAAREAVEWAGGITGIVDIHQTVPNEETLGKIAAIFPKKNLMFQIWNARAAEYDTDLPDWTPREGYVEGVKRIHGAGFKAMAYVNTYCANYLSPVWKRDNLSDFVLTRKASAWTYKGKSVEDLGSPLNEKLLGTVDPPKGGDQFAEIPEGRLLYIDPLTPRWRTYHAEMVKEWNGITGTDANYEDTAGTVADSGNGVVEGLSAGQGSVEIMRVLQKTQPHVPMSSEYGPAGIAFATSWALNYAGYWGNLDFKKYRIGHQLPLTTYLYGYRQWVTALSAWSDAIYHGMAAASDATGGMGFMLVDPFLRNDRETLEKQYNWPGHLFHRTRIFSDRELAPHFPEGNYPAQVRCFYQGVDGLYRYVDDGTLQQLIAPTGEPLYGRVYGANRVQTSLWLANWPLQGSGEIRGLSPEAHYPLFPRPAEGADCKIAIPDFPERVALTRYTEGPGYVYLELSPLPGGPKEVALKLESREAFATSYVSDAPVPPGKVEGRLPLQVALLDPSKADNAGHPLRKNDRRLLHGENLFLQNGKNVRSHFVLEVPPEGGAVEFAFCNLQDRYPFHGFDGSIVRLLINGREVKSFDCLTGDTPDTQVRRWRVPAGEYAGGAILVSVETDSKANAIQDRQFISIPRVIPEKIAAFEETLLGEAITK